MINYEELYEFLRKEKHTEQLQSLPKDFVVQFSSYMKEHRKAFGVGDDFFAGDIIQEKKQYENSMTIFRELILRRKKKILNLVFIAAETGVMKKDFTDMLSFEQDLFEKLVRSVEEADKSLSSLLNGGVAEKAATTGKKKVLFIDDIEQFVGMNGEFIGPFKRGDETELEDAVAGILIGDGKCVGR